MYSGRKFLSDIFIARLYILYVIWQFDAKLSRSIKEQEQEQENVKSNFIFHIRYFLD
jgi:hypothetical protein